LYAPRIEVKNSTMAPYRFLFTKKRIGTVPSPDALTLPSELAPQAGFEIVPKPEARALAAYLVSLRADAALFVTPMTAPSAPATTNAPAATTNSPVALGTTTAALSVK
jgi:hypothetical protein